MLKHSLDAVSYALVFSIVFILFNCTEVEEGCIDLRASNFEIEADADCCDTAEECCCTFPNLTLNLFYKLNALDTLSDGSTNFRLGRFYALDNLTDSIRVDSFQIFISNLNAINTSLSDTIKTRETIDLARISPLGQEQEVSLQDNVTLIDFESFRYNLGTYRSDMTIDQIDFDLGLGQNLAAVRPSEIENEHALRSEYTTLFDESAMRYLFGRLGFIVKRGTVEQIVVVDIENGQTINNPLNAPLDFEKGKELAILLRINVLDVFKGIIFDVSSEESSRIINQNLSSNVSIIE